MSLSCLNFEANPEGAMVSLRAGPILSWAWLDDDAEACEMRSVCRRLGNDEEFSRIKTRKTCPDKCSQFKDWRRLCRMVDCGEGRSLYCSRR